MTHRVFVRDAALSLVGQLTYLKLTLVLRFNALSTWTLDADEASLPVIPVGGGIVVVDDDDNVVLSGPATSFSETAADDTRSVTRSYAGVDDDIWLTRRLSFPDPAAAAIAQTAVDSDVRTGAAETVMRQFVTVNAGPLALAARQVPALALEATDGLRGPTDTWTARWENLADLVTRIAAQAGLGYRIVQAGTVLQFEVFTPADRSTTARFSRAAGTLRGYAYTLGAPNATTSVAGGQGTGSDRATAEVINAGAETDWGRVEAFVDSGGANPAALTQAATDNNTSNGPTATLSLSPIDTPTLRYGRDYALGDTVTVDVLTESLVDVVREVTLSTDATGMTVAPVVGNASSTGTDPAVNRAVRALAKRLNNLERSR